MPDGVPGSANIGNHVTIGPNCSLSSCIIDDEVSIGARCSLGEGVKIEKGAIIRPNSYIPPGRLIRSNQIWGGNPVEFIRNLTEKEIYHNYIQSYKNWEIARSHLEDYSNREKLDELALDSNSLVSEYLTENYFKWRGKYYC